MIGQSLYVLNNKLEPNLKKKDWYEITKKSTEKSVVLRRVGTSKSFEISRKLFVAGRGAGHFLFLDEMV